METSHRYHAKELAENTFEITDKLGQVFRLKLVMKREKEHLYEVFFNGKKTDYFVKIFRSKKRYEATLESGGIIIRKTTIVKRGKVPSFRKACRRVYMNLLWPEFKEC